MCTAQARGRLPVALRAQLGWGVKDRGESVQAYGLSTPSPSVLEATEWLPPRFP